MSRQLQFSLCSNPRKQGLKRSKKNCYGERTILFKSKKTRVETFLSDYCLLVYLWFKSKKTRVETDFYMFFMKRKRESSNPRKQGLKLMTSLIFSSVIFCSNPRKQGLKRRRPCSSLPISHRFKSKKTRVETILPNSEFPENQLFKSKKTRVETAARRVQARQEGDVQIQENKG